MNFGKSAVGREVNGTIFPVYEADVEHPYLKWFTQKTAAKKSNALPEIPAEKTKGRVQRLAKGIYLSFLPVFKTEEMEEVVDFLKIHLLNEMPVDVKFSYDVRLENQSEFRHEGIIHAFSNIYLHNVPYGDMNDQPRFHWKFVDTSNVQMETAEGVLRIRPVKLFEHVNNVMFNSEPSFSYILIDDFKPKQKPEPREQFPMPLKIDGIVDLRSRTVEPAKYELDLHIEQLVSSTKGLSNAEISKKQMDTLERYLHLAIVHRLERMIVIHGLGKGRLKEEVHAMLKQIPEVSRFKNEWSGKYGFGATEVFFRY